MSTRPELARDRLVLVGADYDGSGDRTAVPNHGTIPGVVLHALIAETILSGYPVRSVPPAAIAMVTGVTCAFLCAATLSWRAHGRLPLSSFR